MFEIFKKLDFPTNVEGFSFTEYLTVFLGLIFALAVGEFFISIGGILRERKRFTFYWEFYLWIFILLDLFILTWYIFWVRMPYLENGLTYFYLFTLPNLIIFLLVAVYFPSTKGEGKIDLKAHFNSKVRLCFGLFGAYLLLDFLTELAIEPHLGWLTIWGHILYITMSILNSLYPRVWLRMLFVFFFFIHISAFFLMI